MSFRPCKLAQMAFAVALFTICLASPASAARDDDKDEDGPLREGGITYAETTKPWIQWVAGAFIIGSCLAVAAQNPHRSHLD